MAKFNRDIISSYLDSLYKIEVYIQNCIKDNQELKERSKTAQNTIDSIQESLNNKPFLFNEISYWGAVPFVISFPLLKLAHVLMRINIDPYNLWLSFVVTVIGILIFIIWVIAWLTRIVGVIWLFFSITSGIKIYNNKKRIYKLNKNKDKNGEIQQLYNYVASMQQTINNNAETINRAIEIKERLYNENIIAQKFRSINTINYLHSYCLNSLEKEIDIDEVLIRMQIENVQKSITPIEDNVEIESKLINNVSVNQIISAKNIKKMSNDLLDEIDDISDSQLQKESYLSIVKGISEAEAFFTVAKHFQS